MGGFDPLSTVELAQLTDLCRRWVEVHPDDVEALDLMERARRTLDEALRPWRAAIEAARDRMAARAQVPPEVMPGEHLVEGGAPLFVIHANGGVHYWRGEPVELIGPHIDVDAVAKAAGTIGYEILTSLGRRYLRHYVRGAA